MEKNDFKIGIGFIICLIIGSLATRSSPVTSSSTNDITINQELPNDFEKNSKNFKKNENFSKNLKKFKKLNINTATLQDFKDAKVGIGKKKYKKIVDNRPFKDVSELIDKKIIGFYAYKNIKDIAVVE